jgi:hypothetical protein
MGKEITGELECEPAKFYIKRYIHYKYAAKNGESVRIGELPDLVIDKGIPGIGATGDDNHGQICSSPPAVPPEADLRQGKYTNPVINNRWMEKESAEKTRTTV